MIAVDTNVLIYGRDPRDATKRQRANDLIREIDDGILLWQVACEFLAASRKLSGPDATHAHALRHLQVLQASWRLSLPTWNVFERACQLMADCSIAVWDALIVAACLEAGVTQLWSEDIRPHPVFGSLSVENPFA